MFCYTGTFITIFLLLNHHNPAASRSIEGAKKQDKKEKRDHEVTATRNQTDSSEPHSRHKRSWSSAFQLAAAGSFIASTGVTVYTQISKCKHFKPFSCDIQPTCEVYDCPNVCQTPDVNSQYLKDQRAEINTLLDEMDKMSLDAQQLALDSQSIIIATESIYYKIDNINEKVDRFMWTMAQADRNVSKEFAERSLVIQALLRDVRFDLSEIVGGGEVEGMFDKWTWEEDGLLALSIALPIGAKVTSMVRQRYAVNQMYKTMKSDFLAKVNSAGGSSIYKSFRYDSWVKSLRNAKVDAHLKQCAKIEYKAQVAQETPSKWATGISLAINGIVTALSIWQTIQAVWGCYKLADQMRDDALTMAEQRDAIEKINTNDLLPLWEQVQTESWGAAKEMLTGENMTLWLGEIKNLTLSAQDPNITTADTIDYFLENIGAAGVDSTVTLQSQLIEALDSIGFKYDCLGDKMHAINTVINDCRTGVGELSLQELYNKVALDNNELNRDDCVNDDMVPYTSFEQFQTIVDAFAEHEGDWSSNCLLNSDSLSYLVCNENLKGYDANALVSIVNNTKVTLDMVETLLSSCPDPSITPASITTTCSGYCSYLSVSQIAPQALLKESQVESIIETCPICEFDYKDVTEICHQHYCESVNITVIMDDVELPFPTVEFVIANNCSSKCIIYDKDVKEDICEDSECKGLTTSAIADDVGYPEDTVNDVISNCNTILPSCPPIDDTTKGQICYLYCLLVSPETIAGTVTLKDTRVQEVIDDDCLICTYDASTAKKVCDKYYCESVNTTTIMNDVRLPVSTVDHVIANDCQGKCVIDDDDLKKEICEDYKCNDKSAATIAAGVGYPEQAVNDVISNCDTILPSCPGIDEALKDKVKTYVCVYKVPVSVVAGDFGLTVEQVQAIKDENCP